MLGLVNHPPHLGADDVTGDRDPSGATDVQRARERAVVAGIYVQPVDQLKLSGVRLLDPLDAVDLRELGEQLGPDVGAGAAGDVVEQDRPVGDAGDGFIVALEPERAGAVVVRRHGDDRVRAERGRAFGEQDGVARVVGAGAGHDRLAGGALGERQLDQGKLLLVGERRGLAGGRRHHEAIRAVRGEVGHQRDEGILIDAPRSVKGRDDRGQDRA